MKENNNVFLARLVSFSQNTLLFKINELDENIGTEEFKLVAIKGNWAYDLINYKRYFIITNAIGGIDDRLLDKLKPNVLYVYQTWAFIDLWESIKEVYGIEESLTDFLEKSIECIDNLDSLLASDDKVIDLNKVKKLINEGKL